MTSGINQKDSEGRRHGMWKIPVFYHIYFGQYLHGQKYGLWQCYTEKGSFIGSDYKTYHLLIK